MDEIGIRNCGPVLMYSCSLEISEAKMKMKELSTKKCTRSAYASIARRISKLKFQKTAACTILFNAPRSMLVGEIHVLGFCSAHYPG